MTYYFRLPSKEFIEQQEKLAKVDKRFGIKHGDGNETVDNKRGVNCAPWSREEFKDALINFLRTKRFRDVPNNILELKGFLIGVMSELCDKTVLPGGIANTMAFMENLFCTVVCLDAKIPLIIVGPPGCSKTLSFKIAEDNMKGRSSKSEFYRSLHQIISLRYQCSEQSTDVEIKSVYDNAISRQKAFASGSQEMCAVLLDEVGLPDEIQSPLKILHYKLDHPKVASVLLSNKILDEAKTNRALMLLQSEPPTKDLHTLAEGCIYCNIQGIGK